MDNSIQLYEHLDRFQTGTDGNCRDWVEKLTNFVKSDLNDDQLDPNYFMGVIVNDRRQIARIYGKNGQVSPNPDIAGVIVYKVLRKHRHGGTETISFTIKVVAIRSIVNKRTMVNLLREKGMDEAKAEGCGTHMLDEVEKNLREKMRRHRLPGKIRLEALPNVVGFYEKKGFKEDKSETPSEEGLTPMVKEFNV